MTMHLWVSAHDITVENSHHLICNLFYGIGKIMCDGIGELTQIFVIIPIRRNRGMKKLFKVLCFSTEAIHSRKRYCIRRDIFHIPNLFKFFYRTIFFYSEIIECLFVALTMVYSASTPKMCFATKAVTNMVTDDSICIR